MSVSTTPRHAWKAVLADMEIAKPDLVAPLDWNPNLITYYGQQLEMRFTWRRMPDGWWIWRLE